ncbi:hypothetical protein ACFVJ8_34270 [Streptomyces yangpuensis]|uniref:hypothetical protein n=1 Tax=Streptomyces yangpuensis TaxID=1648182 RepID=UPI003626ADC1
MNEKQAQPVSLNDVAELVELIKEGRLDELVSSAEAAGCGCRGGSCRGRSGVQEELKELPLPEMMERIAELRRQIDEAEQLIAQAKSGSAAR